MWIICSTNPTGIKKKKVTIWEVLCRYCSVTLDIKTLGNIKEMKLVFSAVLVPIAMCCLDLNSSEQCVCFCGSHCSTISHEVFDSQLHPGCNSMLSCFHKQRQTRNAFLFFLFFPSMTCTNSGGCRVNQVSEMILA